MELDPKSLDIPDRYKLLIGGIVPRPIAFVSTLSMSNKLNLAPFSFFAGVSSNPMTILFCPANKPDGTDKDTLRNALPVAEGGRGEFVVNVVSHVFARQMSACAEELPFGDSEFDLSGLTARSSTRVANGVVQVWSDDAYDALDPAEIRTRVTSALQLITIGVDAAPQRDPDAAGGRVDWHTWVIE